MLACGWLFLFFRVSFDSSINRHCFMLNQDLVLVLDLERLLVLGLESVLGSDSGQKCVQEEGLISVLDFD